MVMGVCREDMVPADLSAYGRSWQGCYRCFRKARRIRNITATFFGDWLPCGKHRPSMSVQEMRFFSGEEWKAGRKYSAQYCFEGAFRADYGIIVPYGEKEQTSCHGYCYSEFNWQKSAYILCLSVYAVSVSGGGVYGFEHTERQCAMGLSSVFSDYGCADRFLL